MKKALLIAYCCLSQIFLFAQKDTLALVLNSNKHFILTDSFPKELQTQECVLLLKNDSLVKGRFTQQKYQSLKESLSTTGSGGIFGNLIRPTQINFSYNAPLYYTSDFGTNGEFNYYSDSIFISLYQNEQTHAGIYYSVNNFEGNSFQNSTLSEKDTIDKVFVLPKTSSWEDSTVFVSFRMARQTISWQFKKTKLDLEDQFLPNTSFDNRLHNALLFESLDLIWDAKRIYLQMILEDKTTLSKQLYDAFLSRTKKKVQKMR